MRLVSSLIFFAMMTSGAIADEANPTPREIITGLADQLYIVGETTGKYRDFMSRVETARASIAAYAGDPAEFTKADERGMTPLSIAAESGYAELVEELLKLDEVKASVNTPDTDGFTPWLSANFAFAEAGWVCSPSAFADPQRWVPTYVKLPYYKGEGEAKYIATRRLLEEAGAKPDIDGAKRLYLGFCKNATADSRAAIETSDDVLAAVRAEGDKALDQLQKQTQ